MDDSALPTAAAFSGGVFPVEREFNFRPMCDSGINRKRLLYLDLGFLTFFSDESKKFEEPRGGEELPN